MSRREPQPGIEARWLFICPRCGEGQPGDRVVFQRGVAYHVACWLEGHE